MLGAIKSLFGVGPKVKAETKGARQTEKFEDVTKKSRQQFGAAKERSEFTTPFTQRQIERLEQRATGEGPSVTDEQLKAAQDRTLAQQLAAAASRGRGASAASVSRALARSQAQTGQELAQQAVPARIQEQIQNEQLLGQIRGQEQAQADQLTQQYLALGLNAAQAQAAANRDVNQQILQARMAEAKLQQEAGQFGLNALTGLVTGGASLLKGKLGGLAKSTGGGGGGGGSSLASAISTRNRSQIVK
jgi:hypothetical protein